LATFTYSCTTEPHYTINGTIDGISEGTVKLSYYSPDDGFDLIDTTELVDGKFTFTGKVDFPDRYYLFVKGKGSFNFFLENSEITINAHIDTLWDSEIIGSVIQDDYDFFDRLRTDNSKKLKPINEEISAAKEKGDNELVAELEKKIKTRIDEYIKMTTDFLKELPASFASPYILNYIASKLDVVELESCLDGFDEVLDSIPRIILLRERVEILKRVGIGQPAPDFTLNDTVGNPVTLSSLFGNYLLIEFWFASCSPCRAENPNLISLYNDYHDKGFEIIGVSTDGERGNDKKKWLKAIEEDSLPWINVVTNRGLGDVSDLYGVRVFPDNFLLDKNGIIIAMDIYGEELRKKISELLDH